MTTPITTQARRTGVQARITKSRAAQTETAAEQTIDQAQRTAEEAKRTAKASLTDAGYIAIGASDFAVKTARKLATELPEHVWAAATSAPDVLRSVSNQTITQTQRTLIELSERGRKLTGRVAADADVEQATNEAQVKARTAKAQTKVAKAQSKAATSNAKRAASKGVEAVEDTAEAAKATAGALADETAPEKN